MISYKRLIIICAFLGTFGGCSITVTAQSRVTSSKGIRYTYDDSDRIVAISYYGRSGLSELAAKNVSQVEGIEIIYGARLSADDVSLLSTLDTVKELSIGGNLSDEFVEIEDGLAPFGKLTRLEYLFLCKRDMHDNDLEFVAQLPHIQHLEFLGGPNSNQKNGSAVTDACAEFLRRATTLRHLCIYGGNQLSDQFVLMIARDLKNLEHLKIGSGLLTDRSLQVLAEQCGNLRWLDLYSNHFTDRGVSYLANAKKLEALWLGSTALTHECVNSISGLVELRHLELTFSTITDDDARVLAGLPALEILALRKPPLTNEQFAMFAHHPALKSAFLNGRDLSLAETIETIKTIPNLDHLSIADNKALQMSVDQFLASRNWGAEHTKSQTGG